MTYKNVSKILLITVLSVIMAVSSSCAQPENRTAKYVDLTDAAESSVNAVVYIKTEFMQKNSAWDDFFGGTIWEHFFGSTPSAYPVQAAGSGVIISSDG